MTPPDHSQPADVRLLVWESAQGRKRSFASKSQHFADGFPMDLDCSRYSLGFLLVVRGREPGYPGPPAQIRASGIPALGSYLGCLTANRTLGQGCRNGAWGEFVASSPSAPRPRVPSGSAGKAVGAKRQLRGSETRITPDRRSVRRGRRISGTTCASQFPISGTGPCFRCRSSSFISRSFATMLSPRDFRLPESGPDGICRR